VILHSHTPLTANEKFTFHKIFHTFANNGTPITKDLDIHTDIMQWIRLGTKRVINCVAFGGSSTGKSHTLFGGLRNIGVTFLLLHEIFNFIDEEYNRQERENTPQPDRVTYCVKLSCLELYNNDIIDLTKEEDSPLKQLSDTDRIRLHPELEVFYVEGMKYKSVSSLEAAQKLLNTCLKRRHLGKFSIPHQKENKSNKGHVLVDVVFEKHIPQRIHDDRVSELLGLARGYDKEVQKTLIRIADTAASYEQKHSAYPQRASTEDIAIQKGITGIQKCINAMGQASVIPYRETCLTHLLRDVFFPKTPLYMIVTARPEVEFHSETLLNLQYISKLQKKRDSQPVRPPSPSISRRRSNSSSSLRQRPKRSRSSSVLSSPGTPSTPGTPFDNLSPRLVSSPSMNHVSELSSLRDENRKLKDRVAELEEQMRIMKNQKLKFVRDLVMLSKEYKEV